ncbi:Hemerythrin HHE cation binding domain-containing protein [Andreprevotia lacus DSM 23236]|jgi:hemerythrin-like domain-containing protein|uniref:Hemerythrin HHE cation binding domain-containing protein n=1 Tax=Andreprevotia lacus DSM 23236 TaxID=1121001 RepID=A0A1W1WYV3_9NEIS|nr:hemerythrin domain-containing protein [Andreprevotia lacus]SMC16730.1 Hemerythrin HHE cation binding domain-containing protein [Andreprevotia lacus DSM 23236]
MIANPFETSSASFESPLELLLACHERIRRFCTLLERLGVHLATHGSDDMARDAATGILRYFDIALPLHHQDEDDDLFPALLAVAGSALQAELAALQQEHAQLLPLWPPLRAVLVAVQAGASPAWPAAAAADFAARYHAHVSREETMVYPHAEQLLPAAMLAQLGERMAARRRF